MVVVVRTWLLVVCTWLVVVCTWCIKWWWYVAPPSHLAILRHPPPLQQADHSQRVEDHTDPSPPRGVPTYFPPLTLLCRPAPRVESLGQHAATELSLHLLRWRHLHASIFGSKGLGPTLLSRCPNPSARQFGLMGAGPTLLTRCPPLSAWLLGPTGLGNEAHVHAVHVDGQIPQLCTAMRVFV